MEAIGKVVLTIAVNYGVHYASMTTHNWMCIPHTLGEVVKSVFMVSSPVCSALMTVGQQTQNAYGTAVTMGVVTLITNGLKTL
jgi:hypothetical protein